jgi:hypothetical protein
MKLTLMRAVIPAFAFACLTGCSKDSNSGGGDSSKPDITRELEAYYSFDSNLLADSSSNASGGAVNHGASLTVDHLGNANSAAFFQDSAYIEIPASAATDFHKDLTINTWVNLTDSQSTELLTAIVSKGDSSNYIWQLGVSQARASGEYGIGQTWLLKYVNLKEADPLTVYAYHDGRQISRHRQFVCKHGARGQLHQQRNHFNRYFGCRQQSHPDRNGAEPAFLVERGCRRSSVIQQGYKHR